MNQVQGPPYGPRDLRSCPGTEWNLLVSTSQTLLPGLSILGLVSHEGLSLVAKWAAALIAMSSFLAHSGLVRAV